MLPENLSTARSALIENNTLVIGILTQNELYEKTVSNMVECKARGAYLMGLFMCLYAVIHGIREMNRNGYLKTLGIIYAKRS